MVFVSSDILLLIKNVMHLTKCVIRFALQFINLVKLSFIILTGWLFLKRDIQIDFYKVVQPKIVNIVCYYYVDINLM